MHADFTLRPNINWMYSVNYARAELWFQTNGFLVQMLRNFQFWSKVIIYSFAIIINHQLWKCCYWYWFWCWYYGWRWWWLCVSSGAVDIFISSMTVVDVSAWKIKLTFDNFHKIYHGYLNIELCFSTKWRFHSQLTKLFIGSINAQLIFVFLSLMSFYHYI